MNKAPLLNLFKPYKLEFIGIEDLLKVTKLSKNRFIEKIMYSAECSKSKNETCANFGCSKNYIKYHGIIGGDAVD